MKIYKTTAGLTKACEALIDELGIANIADQKEYDRLNRKSSSLIRQCKALWTSPADSTHFAGLASSVADAWNRLAMA